MKTLIVLIAMILAAPAAVADSRDLRTDPIANAEITDAIKSIKTKIGKPDLETVAIVFARGTQEYRFSTAQNQWIPTGPKADLYPYNQRFLTTGLTKIGTHYENLKSPAWKIPVGEDMVEVVAIGKKELPGATDNDVSWLHVQLADNSAGISDVFRIHTRAGVQPGFTARDGFSYGVSYETVYAFVKNK